MICEYLVPPLSDFETLTSDNNWKPSSPIPCTRLAIGIDADGHTVCPEHCNWQSVRLVPRWLEVLERATRARPGQLRCILHCNTTCGCSMSITEPAPYPRDYEEREGEPVPMGFLNSQGFPIYTGAVYGPDDGS